MSTETNEFYDLLGKKEGWTIEEMRIMFFPKIFLDEGEIFNPSKTLNGEKPLWTKMHELMLAAIDNGSIKFLNNSSKGEGPNARLSPESVIGWIQFQEIFKWLTKKGWEKPQQLDALIKSLNKNPLNGTQTKMAEEIADLKKENKELKAKNEEQKEKLRNHPIRHRDVQIRILAGALKMVDKSEKVIFHSSGKLNASQLADRVSNFRLISGLEDGKLTCETIKRHIEIALRPPTKINNDDMRYDLECPLCPYKGDIDLA